MSNLPTFTRPTLALAFGLEVAAVVTYGVWAWHTVPGPLRGPAAIGLPLAVAAVWGVFATAGAQVTGTTVVATPGPVRLVLELLVLGGAVAALADLGDRTPATWFGALLVLQLFLTRGRLRWLLAN